MASFNLVRNSRVFFTTNLTNVVVQATGFTAANTFELQVLDGFKFGQTTQTTNVTLNEAGAVPNRGQRNFNTSLSPVDFSFNTYLRPRMSASITSGGATPANQVSAEERVLWNALFGDQINDTTLAIVASTATATVTRASAAVADATITGTAMTITGMAIGQVWTFKGLALVGGTVASEWNTPFQITGTPTATSIPIKYLSQPNSSAGTTITGVGAIAVRSAWIEQAANTTSTAVASYAMTHTGNSNKNTLVPFGLIFQVDNVTYVVDNCALDQAVIDFGLDQIAQVAWTGKGTALRQLTGLTTMANVNTDPTMTVVFTAATAVGLAGTATGKITSANYITNKLSTVSLVSNISGISGTSYTLALTGGSITIANGINYITPANIGVVNSAIGYYTSTRQISGTITAYLRTGTTAAPNSTGVLLSTLLAASSTATDPKYRLQIEIGGAANATRVEVEMEGCMLAIPTVETATVMSTTIAFTAQGSEAAINATPANTNFDIENTNDLQARYYSAATT